MVTAAAQILDNEFDPPAMRDTELAVTYVADTTRPRHSDDTSAGS